MRFSDGASLSCRISSICYLLRKLRRSGVFTKLVNSRRPTCSAMQLIMYSFLAILMFRRYSFILIVLFRITCSCEWNNVSSISACVLVSVRPCWASSWKGSSSYFITTSFFCMSLNCSNMFSRNFARYLSSFLSSLRIASIRWSKFGSCAEILINWSCNIWIFCMFCSLLICCLFPWMKMSILSRFWKNSKFSYSMYKFFSCVCL